MRDQKIKLEKKAKLMTVKNRILFSLLPLMFVIISIFLFEQMLDIGFSEKLSSLPGRQIAENDNGPVYQIGVVSRFSPSLLYRGYQPLISYLNRMTPYSFELRLNRSYDQAVQELASGKLQAAFLGTYIFLTYMDKQPINAFLAPLNPDGKPHFQIVLITREDFPFRSLRDFSAKRIGVPAPMSFSGNWLQKFVLPQNWPVTLAPPRFISYDFHHTVVQHVLRGDLAGGVVKDRVAAEYTGKGIRIIRKSRFIPASPLVKGPASKKQIIDAIQTVLTNIPAENVHILTQWDAEFQHGFVRVDDETYKRFKQELTMIKEKKQYANFPALQDN